jgi:quinol monooxygenase YgiN
MLVRIVKMSFEPAKIPEFLDNFHQHKNAIRNFEGCKLLELYADKNQSNIYFTYSYWENDINLENYRNSDLFKKVWAKTKPLFNNRPQAWSVDKIVTL